MFDGRTFSLGPCYRGSSLTAPVEAICFETFKCIYQYGIGMDTVLDIIAMFESPFTNVESPFTNV